MGPAHHRGGPGAGAAERQAVTQEHHASGFKAAMYSPRAWLVFVSTAAVCLVIDLVSKYIAFEHIADREVPVDREAVLAAQARGLDLSVLIPRHEPVIVVPHVLELTLVLNPGAVFGIGAGKRTFFIVFTIIAVAFVSWAFARWTRSRDWWAHVAAGCVIGGGIGNLYDRVVYACVRDFLHPLPTATIPFSGGRPLWPYVSNIADAMLIVGIGVLVIYSWFSKDEPGDSPAQPDAARPEGAQPG